MMKNNVKYLLSLLVIIEAACTGPATKTDMSVLVVAGGHAYDTLAFQAVFETMEGLQAEFVMQPLANQMIADGEANAYDVIVFYDSWQTISEREKQAYLQLLDQGMGMVFMHHALVSYQDWPEFTNIIGGKYLHPKYTGDTQIASDYKHDIWLHVQVNQDHPITRDIDDFDIFDEGYMKLYISSGVSPLLTTSHEFCDEVIGWVHQEKNSRVVYLLPGHAAEGLGHPGYRQIIANAIQWVSE